MANDWTVAAAALAPSSTTSSVTVELFYGTKMIPKIIIF